MADSTQTSSFVFADHLKLDESLTRDFYKSVLQGLIHKNNNTLGVIQGFSSLVLMDDDVPGEVRENVEQMRESALGASDLAKIILTAAGCARVVCEAVNLNDFMPHIEDTARQICAKHGVPLKFQATPGLPLVKADAGRLNELLGELIKNAAESAADIPGGEVAIDIFPPGGASGASENAVDIFIRNSSVDLSQEKIRDYYLPFNGNKGNAHYGLGLTTAGVLAGQMRMSLGLRSVDGTTTAWLSLPVAG